MKISLIEIVAIGFGFILGTTYFVLGQYVPAVLFLALAGVILLFEQPKHSCPQLRPWLKRVVLKKCQSIEFDGIVYEKYRDGSLAVLGYTNPRSYMDIPSKVYECPVLKIMAGAFKGCDKLYTLKIHEGISKIGNGAFQDCANLRLIELPASLCYIGVEAIPDIGAKLYENEEQAYRAQLQNDPWARKEYGLYDTIVVESKPGEVKVVSGSYAERYCQKHGIKYIVK